MGHKCSDRDDFNKNHQRKPVQIIKFKRKNGFKKSMKPTSRLNGIKENSKDILEENVEMGVSCSTIIDDKQGKARNNIKGWWRPVSEKEDQVPVIVEAFSEEGQLRDGLVEDGSLDKQGNLSRLNKIKEKSKVILEENVEKGMSCSSIIDDKQDKARNNIEVVSEKEDQVPVTVKVFSEEGQVRDGLVEIKEKSKDIQEENVNMEISCSTIIDSEQGKVRNNIEVVSEKEDQAPVIDEAFSEEGQVRDGLVENGSLEKQGNLSTLNEIKENSNDILEENVEKGMSCSTIIDDKQDKARNNTEVVPEKEDQVPVIVEVFSEEGQVRDGLVEADLLEDILIDESLGNDYIIGDGPIRLISEETLDTLELKNGNDGVTGNSTENDSLVSSTDNQVVIDDLIPSWAASTTGIQQGDLLRLNEIKENSKDIQEENVKMGIICSTIIDCKQDKSRNIIEDWWKPVSEKRDQVPVIVEVFQEGIINNWRDPLGRAIGSSNRFLELYQF